MTPPSTCSLPSAPNPRTASARPLQRSPAQVCALPLVLTFVVQYTTHVSHRHFPILSSLCLPLTPPLCVRTGGGGGGKGPAARLLRLMLKLRAAEVGRHKHLLLSIASMRPSLAAAYTAALPFSLEPRLSLRWVAATALLLQLTPAVQRHLAGSLSSSLPPPGASVANAAELAPPAVDGGVVRALLKAVVPPSATKAGLSRGLQHSSLLVRQVCACVGQVPFLLQCALPCHAWCRPPAGMVTRASAHVL